jgi:CxxC motif-containing protein
MQEIKEIYCVTCPKGCKLSVVMEGERIVEVKHGCKRGTDYAHEELTHPKRMVATSVQLDGGVHPLVAVYTDQPIDKLLITPLLAALREVHVQAPVKMGAVVLANALDSGVNVLASRSVERKAG